MYVTIKRKRGLIEADPGGAGIIAISRGGDLTIELGFTLAQDIDQHARSVKLSAYTRILPRPTFLDHVRPGKVNHDLLMGAIKTVMPVAKARMKAQSDLMVASRTEAISTFIAASRTIGRAIEFIDSVEAESRGIRFGALPSTASATRDLIVPETSRELLLDAIVFHGVDPGAAVTELKPAAIDPSRTFSGFSAGAANAQLPVPILKHLAALTSSTTSTALIAVPVIVERDTTARAAGAVRITVPASRLAASADDGGKLVLVLQALDDGGIDVDSVNLEFDVQAQISTFKTPKVAPVITASQGQSTTTLNVRAGDDVTERIRIVSRTISRSVQTEPGYAVIAEFPVTSKTHDATVTIPSPTSSTVIYRAFPIGEGDRIGAPFGSAVLRPPRASTPARAAIAAIPTEDGLAIEIRSIPTRVKSIQVLRRDMTLREKTYVPVGFPIRIDDSERSLDHISIVDRGLKPDHVYEHSCRVTHVDGKTAVLGLVHTEYVPFSQGIVATEIQDLTVDRESGSPDVVFTVKSTIVDTRLDAVRKTLEAQGVGTKYESELTAEREEFQKLLIHLITRVDMHEGRRENMGVLVGSSFRDSRSRTLGTAELTEGKRYRYEVTAALRSPETMLPSYTKTKIDQATRKSFKLRPSKWWHPYTLKRGTLTSAGTLLALHAKDEFSYGSVGNITAVDVVLDAAIARITDSAAAPFDSRTARIEWRISGDQSTIDHFIILQNANNSRSVVGTCHPDFPHGTYEFFHIGPSGENGPRTYTVIAVTHDLAIGDSQTTDEITL